MAKDRGSRPSEKRRRHGYRGYGSPLGRKGEDYGGSVHWGRGFSGIGSPGDSGSILPRAEMPSIAEIIRRDS
jgi:hypothetical protein